MGRADVGGLCRLLLCRRVVSDKLVHGAQARIAAGALLQLVSELLRGAKPTTTPGRPGVHSTALKEPPDGAFIAAVCQSIDPSCRLEILLPVTKLKVLG